MCVRVCLEEGCTDVEGGGSYFLFNAQSATQVMSAISSQAMVELTLRSQ